MKSQNSFAPLRSTLPALKLNEEHPERSSGLSSYRCMFEKTLRPVFNNPDLTNEVFLAMLHKLILGLLEYEQYILPKGSHSITDILKARQNAKR